MMLVKLGRMRGTECQQSCASMAGRQRISMCGFVYAPFDHGHTAAAALTRVLVRGDNTIAEGHCSALPTLTALDRGWLDHEPGEQA